MQKHQFFDLIEQVRAQTPLVHNITNYVVMNNTANALLAAGASPIMSHAHEEVADMVGISNALVINMGTLSPYWVASMEKAIQTAKILNKPFVFDPVGAGASAYRNTTVAQLLYHGTPTVIRGNASEIIAVQNNQSKTKGVDSTHDSKDALATAQTLSRELNATICISGAIDYVVHQDRVGSIQNGHSLMSKVTGMGCTATSLIGAFIGVHPHPFEATMAAMAMMGVAGELAGKTAHGPGSMQLHLLDQLHHMDRDTFEEILKFECLN